LYQVIRYVSSECIESGTGGIERFSAKGIFGKALKVTHFYLGFSPDKNNN